MTDQVSSFNARGLKASCVGVNICSKDQPTCEDAIVRGDFQLLFINPETLLSDTAWRDMFRTPVYQENLVALAIDEAHLVEKWSVYRLLHKLSQAFKTIHNVQ